MNETVIKKKRKAKGQTLAEFALTLPLLLLLIFLIIEFGRILQAWVTIQNAAREATRYTTTGQFDRDKYDMDALLHCDSADLRTGIVRQEFGDGMMVEFYAAPDLTQTGEDIYATWYNGENCEPSAASFERRRDILRVASIMDQARVGAAGLSLEPNPLDGSSQSITNLLYHTWTLPTPRANQPGYFNVVICSSRPFLTPTASIELDPRYDKLRFLTIYDATNIPAGLDNGYTPPYCMMNEHAGLDASPEYISNPGVPWLDAGGPGDRVSIFVTFNHPLITPLGFAEYITMRARRSGVNETFRTSRALSAVVGAPPGVGGFDTPTPLPPTDTPEPTATFTETPIDTDTPTPTYTYTPAPFSCDAITVGNLRFSGQRVSVLIENRNEAPTQLLRSYMTWRRPVDYPGMYLSAQAINDDAFWFGEQFTAPFDTAEFLAGTPNYNNFMNANRVVASQQIGRWEAAFLGAGFNLALVLNDYDFNGSYLDFSNPETGGSCRVNWDVPVPPPPLDPDDIPDDATATFTPDCASDSLRVEFVRFDDFGAVQLRITNNRFQPAPFLGFEINWPDPATDLDTNLSGVLTLRKISLGGVDADDFGTASSEGVLVWRSNFNAGSSIGDPSPTTRHTDGDFWRDNYVFPPRSSTSMWLDFEGTPSRLDLAFGIGPWMFNNSQFDIGCGSTSTGGGGGTGGNGGSGGTTGGSGSIILSEIPIPQPTNTPRPTNTPGPTLTPSPTMPTNTPTNTWTPGPTFTPSNTFTPSPTLPPQLPTDIPTQSGNPADNV